jgi:acylphosphatase
MKRVHVHISGLVQGVFFRAKIRKEALSLGISGLVRNLSDGRVEAVFEGEDRHVDAMVQWCKVGPSHAVVEDLRADEEPFSGLFKDFSIRY